MSSNTVAMVMYALAAVLLTAMVFRYTRYSDWRSTAAGRSFLYLQVMFLVILVFVFARVAWPDVAWLEWVRPAILGGIDAALAYQLYTVVKYQGGWRDQGTRVGRASASDEVREGRAGRTPDAGHPGPHALQR